MRYELFDVSRFQSFCDTAYLSHYEIQTSPLKRRLRVPRNKR